MKIAYIIPGSGGSFYCGNCLRDSDFTKAIKKTGNDIIIIPMYLPVDVAKNNIGDTPIFYGAVNTYLKELNPIFRHMPKWMERFLNSDWILAFAAKQAGSTNPVGLEKMTISMLKGEHGNQADDLEMMVKWLKDHEKPDIVHLSNALLTGLAPKLKRELNCKIVCSLQDEDEWIEEMREPYKTDTWELIQENAKSIDAFIAVSKFYASYIRNQMDINDKLYVVYNGIEPEKQKTPKPVPEHHTIGYMSKINTIFGIDILFDAFTILKKEEQFKNLKLKITGGYTDDYKKHVKYIKKKSKKLNISDSVEFFDDLSVEGKATFLQSISLICIPARRKEASALHLLEAFKAQVPAVVPEYGAYPEIIRPTKAGLMYEPNNPENLAETLKKVLSDKKLYNELKQNTLTAITKHFCNECQTAEVENIYKKITNAEIKMQKNAS